MDSRVRSAWMAVGMAPLGIIQCVARQYTDKIWWPFWIDDIVVAVLLGIAGLLVIRDATTTRVRLLSAAWGGMVFVLWTSTFRHLNSLPLDYDAPHLTVMSAGMGGLFLLALIGLLLSLPTTKRPFIGTRPPDEELAARRRNAMR